MHVLIDTCVWSHALRRVHANNQHARELKELILDHRVRMIGPIRQEILSGVRVKQQYNQLREYLAAFPDVLIKTVDYECAAEYSNLLRSKGVQSSAIDALICAVASRCSLQIYTLDSDFTHFSKYLAIKLYALSS